jgi:hypothetical protein
LNLDSDDVLRANNVIEFTRMCMSRDAGKKGSSW